MKKDMIDSIKTFFQAEIKTFWDKQEHVAVHQEAKAIGTLFGKYLYPQCSLDFQNTKIYFHY